MRKGENAADVQYRRRRGLTDLSYRTVGPSSFASTAAWNESAWRAFRAKRRAFGNLHGAYRGCVEGGRFQSERDAAFVGQVGHTPRVDLPWPPQDFNGARFSGVLGQSSGHVIAHGQKTLWVGVRLEL